MQSNKRKFAVHEHIIISGYARTPIGAFQGALSSASATELGAACVREAVARAGADPAGIDRIYMGCVLPAGLGQAPARQAALGAGLPDSVQATTVNKMCGSGMQAAIMAAEALAAGGAELVVAGGMESMSNAPYLLAKHRGGARIGHDVVKDSMYLDGLEDAYEPGRLMGSFAEDSAREYQLTRAAQDAYALRSLQRASTAIASGAFAAEITPVSIAGRGGETVVSTDEQPGRARADKIPTLTRFRQGRHDHRGQRLLHLGRCGCPGHDPRQRGRAARHARGGPHRCHRRPRARARAVHHRTGAGHTPRARAGRVERR